MKRPMSRSMNMAAIATAHAGGAGGGAAPPGGGGRRRPVTLESCGRGLRADRSASGTAQRPGAVGAGEGWMKVEGKGWIDQRHPPATGAYEMRELGQIDMYRHRNVPVTGVAGGPFHSKMRA